MKFLLPLLITLFSLPMAQAAQSPSGWILPISGMEAAFGCRELNPDFALPAVNVAIAGRGEYRLGAKEAFIELRGNGLYLVRGKAEQRLGSLSTSPTCVVEDTGEPATASWNPVAIEKGGQFFLAYAPNPASCRPRLEGSGGYWRTDTYRLSWVDAGGQTVDLLSWRVDAYHPSESECRTY